MKEANQTYVGIDISKDTLDVALRPNDRTWQVSYTEDGIRELVGEVGPLQPELVVMEATGGFEALLVSAMVEEGLRVVVVNPRQVRDFAHRRRRPSSREWESRHPLVCASMRLRRLLCWRKTDGYHAMV